MNLEALSSAVVEFLRANPAWSPIGLGLLAFGESLAFVSLVIPGATILIAVGFLVAAAEISFWQAWLGVATGATLGGWASFEAGRIFKGAAYGVWPLSRHPSLIAKGERLLLRFGPWAVFFSRFFGPTRALVPVTAGIFQMPTPLFQSANMASAFVWGFIVLVPGAGLARYLY